MVAPTIFEDCGSIIDSGNTTELLKCISDSVVRQEDERQRDVNQFLLIISGAMVFFMQAGFAMLCAGSVRVKNVQNTMLKNLLDACGAAVAFFLVGYAFAFGESDEKDITFIGSSGFFTVGASFSFWFFQWTFSASSVTIVAGTLAERCQMAAYLCYSIFLAGFVYPIVAHALWSSNGMLSNSRESPFLDSGVVDFAGSGVVHLTGGTVALYATLVLGPRRGRFYDAQGEPLDTPKPFPGHSVALQVLGTMILWFGWFGFNAGSAMLLDSQETGAIAATAAASTALSGAAGGISALFTNLYIEERRTGEPSFNLLMCMNGALSGLVAITASCGVVEPWAAVVIGTVAGWIYMSGSASLIRWRIDDAVDAIPVHMFNGAWGLFAAGLFASPERLKLAYSNNFAHVGCFYTLKDGPFDAALLANQILAILFIVGWTFFMMMPFFIWLNYMGWLRADSLEELVGLDISYHGGPATTKDGVKKEYIEAYKRHKGQLRNRNGTNSGGANGGVVGNTVEYGGGGGADTTRVSPSTERWLSSATGGTSGGGSAANEENDPETNQLAAANEAMNDDNASIDSDIDFAR